MNKDFVEVFKEAKIAEENKPSTQMNLGGLEVKIQGITIDFGRKHGDMYRRGGMICTAAPWESSGCPITLNICICPDGESLHRGWEWSGDSNTYLHSITKAEAVEVTQEMQNTISGLFSGRILVDGVKIAVGSSVQQICPIDHEKEESLIGRKIYLNG
jgi:hypothetical protein